MIYGIHIEICVRNSLQKHPKGRPKMRWVEYNMKMDLAFRGRWKVKSSAWHDACGVGSAGPNTAVSVLQNS
jgi:hypothetical protein